MALLAAATFTARATVYLKQHDISHIWNIDDLGQDRETSADNLYLTL